MQLGRLPMIDMAMVADVSHPSPFLFGEFTMERPKGQDCYRK